MKSSSSSSGGGWGLTSVYRATALVIALGCLLSVSLANEEEGNKECPSYGCPLLPLDVILNQEASQALQELRSVEEDDEGNEDPLPDKDYIVALAKLASAGDDDKTTLTLQGDKGGPAAEQVNQDSAMIYSPFKIEVTDEKKKRTQLLGVFDGHGNMGEITSKHAATDVPRLLAEKLALISLDDEEAVSNSIKEIFIEVDKTDPTKGVGGCTATIVLQLGAKLYIGNAGDSRSFIAVLVDGEVDVAYASREDKPELPEERDRITKMGGYVHIPTDPTEDVPRAYYVDEEGRAQYGLAMSRSLGDWTVQGVIAEPIVDVVNVADLMSTAIAKYVEACQNGDDDSDDDDSDNDDEDEDEDDSEDAKTLDDEAKEEEIPEKTCEALDPHHVGIIAVSASDGMIDFIDLHEIAYVFAASFCVEDNPHPHTAAEHLIHKAAEMWEETYNGHYRDDIVVAAFKVYSGDDILAEGSSKEEKRDEL